MTEQSSASAVDGLGQRLPHLLGHEHRVHLALPEGVPARASGSTRATARRSGARAAARRSPSTSRRVRRTTASSSTRRCTCASRCVDREGEALVVWTTTPWTLPANVAAAVKPDAEYGLRDGGWRLAEEGERVRQRRRRRGSRRARVPRALRGSGRAGRRHPPRHPVGRGRAGRGHRASSTSRRARAPRTSSSRACTGWRVLTPDRRVRPLPRRLRARSRGSRPTRRPSRSSAALASAACSSRPGTIVHRYPICWRCKTPLVFRVVDDWFIRPTRSAPADARRRTTTVEWTPPSTGSGWTTGCATWTTGTSRASATSGCRCRSTRASAGS